MLKDIHIKTYFHLFFGLSLFRVVEGKIGSVATNLTFNFQLLFNFISLNPSNYKSAKNFTTILYHQVRVGRQLLANQGSISSNVQLQDDTNPVNYQESHLNGALCELNTVISMRPCLCTGVFRSGTGDALEDLLIAEETLSCCSAFHIVHKGLLQVLFGVQHFMVQAGAWVYGQSLQESHSGDDHVHARIDPSEGREDRELGETFNALD